MTDSQFEDYPEADTMETRRALKTRYRMEGAFWAFVIIAIGAFLFINMVTDALVK